MSRKKIKINKSVLTWIIIVVVFLSMEVLLNAPADSVIFDILDTLDVVAFMGVTGLIIVFILYRMGDKAAKSKEFSHQAERVKEIDMRSVMRDNLEEEAIKCAHPRGREKYIHQLDGFLANGLIDKAEYRVMKEKYEKLNIPEDMH